MDTQLIYNYLACLKTGYCESIEEYRRYVIESEIQFRAAYTQYLAQTNGKGYNLILNDFRALERTLQEFIQEDLDANRKEQGLYASEKTAEAIEYIERAREMFDSGEIDTPRKYKLHEEVADTKVISGTEGLAKFLGCGKTMAFSIIKSGVLIEHCIQYKVGNCWKFNVEKLEKFLENRPDFLSDIRCVR